MKTHHTLAIATVAVLGLFMGAVGGQTNASPADPSVATGRIDHSQVNWAAIEPAPNASHLSVAAYE